MSSESSPDSSSQSVYQKKKRLVSTRLNSDCFRVSDCFQTVSDCFRLFQTVSDCFRLFQTVSDCFHFQSSEHLISSHRLPIYSIQSTQVLSLFLLSGPHCMLKRSDMLNSIFVCTRMYKIYWVGLPVLKEMKLFQLSPSRFLFVGFSAGGSLAAFTALRAPWQIGQRAAATLFEAKTRFAE